MSTIELKVPDIGGSAAVIELLVKEGDTITVNQGLLTLGIRQSHHGSAGQRRWRIESNGK